MPADHRRALGSTGERLAREHLERAGYRIVDANYRTRFGELDVVAHGHGALVFCEVKTRAGASSAFGPLVAIGAQKQRRVRRMAREWLADGDRLAPPARAIRFDAIGITLTATGRLVALEHIEGAF